MGHISSTQYIVIGHVLIYGHQSGICDLKNKTCDIIMRHLVTLVGHVTLRMGHVTITMRHLVTLVRHVTSTSTLVLIGLCQADDSVNVKGKHMQ